MVIWITTLALHFNHFLFKSVIPSQTNCVKRIILSGRKIYFKNSFYRNIYNMYKMTIYSSCHYCHTVLKKAKLRSLACFCCQIYHKQRYAKRTSMIITQQLHFPFSRKHFFLAHLLQLKNIYICFAYCFCCC